jgi:hypothetical protein
MLGKVAEKKDHDPSVFLGHFAKVKAIYMKFSPARNVSIVLYAVCRVFAAEIQWYEREVPKYIYESLCLLYFVLLTKFLFCA